MGRHAERQFPKPKRPKTKLGLPDSDHSRSAVQDNLRTPGPRAAIDTIDDFIEWYCSEPRLSFNRVVVTRDRIFLENRQLAAGTINGRFVLAPQQLRRFRASPCADPQARQAEFRPI